MNGDARLLSSRHRWAVDRDHWHHDSASCERHAAVASTRHASPDPMAHKKYKLPCVDSKTGVACHCADLVGLVKLVDHLA